jgi:hypothetical protein
VRPAVAALLALGVALATPTAGAAAVKTGFDRHGGLRLTLDGRVLTATIVRQRAEEDLFGKRIDAVCSSTSPLTRRGLVIRTRLWPEGASRLRFRFKRDVSRNAKWCLIEHRARDVAVVWFIRREPARFIAKGRGPGGDWWRLAGWRGLLAEPCALVRSREWGARPCFAQFADRPVTLAAERLGPCGQDLIVFGVVSRLAASVRLTTSAGAIVEAQLFERPAGSRVRARYFVAALAEGTEITGVESFDAAGARLRRVSANAGSVCGPPGSR